MRNSCKWKKEKKRKSILSPALTSSFSSIFKARITETPLITGHSLKTVKAAGTDPVALWSGFGTIEPLLLVGRPRSDACRLHAGWKKEAAVDIEERQRSEGKEADKLKTMEKKGNLSTQSEACVAPTNAEEQKPFYLSELWQPGGCVVVFSADCKSKYHLLRRTRFDLNCRRNKVFKTTAAKAPKQPKNGQ